MGCTSDLGGNLGVVWIVEDDLDLTHILKTGPTPPYVAVLGKDHYTRSILLQFKENLDRVAGVILLDRNHEDSKSRSTPFTPEDVCPNRYSGLYFNNSHFGDCKQNTWMKESPISGLLYDDIPYPIFFIDDKKSTGDILACFKDNNALYISETTTSTVKKQSTYPLCGMQLDSFMTAATDSELCLNSHSLVDDLLQSNGRRCYPVDNRNIFGFYKHALGPLHPENNSNLLSPDVAPEQSIVMLISKLSSISMFSDISPGADSTITSIVTLLAVAEALGKLRNRTEVLTSTRNIAFALLDSESFDYTGSSRMAFSMAGNTFPQHPFITKWTNITVEAMQNVNLSSIDFIIDLDQMANYPNAESVFFHSNLEEPNPEKVDKIYKLMKRVAASENVSLEREDKELPLPPTPVHQFIKHSQASSSSKLTGLVLSNYGKKYNNLFYNSIYDDSHNIYQTKKSKLVEHIARVSRMIALSLYELTFGVKLKPDELNVDKTTIDQLLECYLIDAQCHLFTRAWRAGQNLPTGPIQTYRDPTKRSDDMNGAITTNLLAYFIGDVINEYNLTQCLNENEQSYKFMFQYVNGNDEPVKDGLSGKCIRSQVIMTSALSPAFTVSEEGILIDRKYPAWTVSLNSIRNPVRLYLKSSPVFQWCIFVLGIVITIASFIIVYHIKKTLFKSVTASEASQTATST